MIRDSVERRVVERNVLKPLVEDFDSQKTRLNEIQQEDFEVPEFRDLLAEIQLSYLAGKSFSSVTCSEKRHRTCVEIITEGVELNGQWSAAAERLRVHKFDSNSFNCTDAGNAQRFLSRYGKEWLFDHAAKEWLHWNGKHWKSDSTGKIYETMLECLRESLAEETGTEKDERRRKDLRTWANHCEDVWYITRAVKSLETVQSISILTPQLDADPWLLNVANGTIDLRTCELLPHDHRRYCSKIAPVKYLPDADAPRFYSFLEKVFCGNKNLIQFTLRFFGYCLTGSTDGQVIVFAYGGGANGKTTLFDTLNLLMGPYYHAAPSDLLVLKRPGSVPTDIADLHGKRLVVVSEVGANRLDEEKVKLLSGGDKINARHLFRLSFQFTPSHKLVIFGNNKPIIYGTDHAFWRRMLVLPFEYTFNEDKRNKSEVLDEFKKELPGILNLFLSGLSEYHQIGLNPPQEVLSASKTYREESDTLGQFIEEVCQKSGKASTKDIHQAYSTWGGTFSQRKFTEELKKRGFESKTGAGNRKFWIDLSLKNE